MRDCNARRSGLYYEACPVSAGDLVILRRIDALHLEYPFAGSRMLRDLLRDEGFEIGRAAVRMMMKRMGVEAMAFYNGIRPHSVHDGRTPDEAYFGFIPLAATE
jgi:hypothetical protein